MSSLFLVAMLAILAKPVVVYGIRGIPMTDAEGRKVRGSTTPMRDQLRPNAFPAPPVKGSP